MIFRQLIVMIVFWALAIPTAIAENMKLAVTTSFHNSGLSEILLPVIKADLGFDVFLLVVGTGQALKLGRGGDVDAILVHSRQAEDQFISEGYATHRRDIMYNDFVLIGPVADSAHVNGSRSAVEAFQKIATSRAVFVSRGDDSGTNRKEELLWKAAGIDLKKLEGGWYRATGAGMGATLNIANAMNGYVFADRASWLNFKNKANLRLLFSGDPILFNQYGYLPINPAEHPHVKADLTDKLEAWLTAQKAQELISTYRIAGEKLFTPNAKPK